MHIDDLGEIQEQRKFQCDWNNDEAIPIMNAHCTIHIKQICYQ